MRSRTANEYKQRAKILLNAIQREYDENQSTKKTNKPQRTTQSPTSNKENDKESEKSRDKKTKKSKPWMPTISFAVPNGNEQKAKKAPNADEPVAGGSGIAPDAIPSTSGLSKQSNAVRKMSLDMPILD